MKKEKVLVCHVKVIGGCTADVYEIGEAMKKLKEKLPYELQAIVTNDNVELRDVDALVEELRQLQRQIKQEEKFKST